MDHKRDQEQLEGNRGGEPNGDAKKPWHEAYASEGDAGENKPCQTTSRETTGEGKEDGGRVYPRDAVRDASCNTRGSQQQMDVFKWT